MTRPEPDWRQRVLGAIGAVVVVGLVIGGVLGAVVYSTARATGLADGASEASASLEADAQEVGSPVAAAASPSVAPETEDAAEEVSPSPAESAKHKTGKAKAKAGHRRDKHHRARQHRKKRHGGRAQLTLVASPHQVRPMGRINLSGRYPGHGGARLAVQRFEGGHWARFPVTVTVRGGKFRTWVASGHRGLNRFRVVAVNSRRSSPSVTVRVR